MIKFIKRKLNIKLMCVIRLLHIKSNKILEPNLSIFKGVMRLVDVIVITRISIVIGSVSTQRLLLLRRRESCHNTLFLSTSIILINFAHSMILRLILSFSSTWSHPICNLNIVGTNYFSIIKSISTSETFSKLSIVIHYSFLTPCNSNASILNVIN